MQAPILHIGVKCSKCLEVPIAGVRYRCFKCADLNFCERCEMLDDHSLLHALVKIRTPEVDPFVVQAETRVEEQIEEH